MSGEGQMFAACSGAAMPTGRKPLVDAVALPPIMKRDGPHSEPPEWFREAMRPFLPSAKLDRIMRRVDENKRIREVLREPTTTAIRQVEAIRKILGERAPV